MSRKLTALVLSVLVLISQLAGAYPIDGFAYTGIRRLVMLEHVLSGELAGRQPLTGALKGMDDIVLHLDSTDVSISSSLPEEDPELNKAINQFFTGLDKNYSISLLDMTNTDELRFASRNGSAGYQPGSVGKLAVINALFCELENIYPDNFEKRAELLRTKIVRAGKWVLTDSHTIPIYDPESKTLIKRQVREDDEFSLYEWADHMMSVSNNGAASVLWREVILMREFSHLYPMLGTDSSNDFFSNTSKSVLSELAIQVVNAPLRYLGIEEDEWRLGQMFTRGATQIIPGKGGSIGSTDGLMKFLFALEQGRVVDQRSSIEIKRLMYMTDRRIRYASAKELNDAAVYFKSGSLYKCDREKNPDCEAYMGNVYNYMNSVIIVEHPEGTRYMVVLMSNVLGKNSNADHASLSRKIDRLILSFH